MGRKKTRLLDPRIAPLRKQIERWSQTRPKPSAKPEVLWGAAAKLAREHGVYAAAQALAFMGGDLQPHFVKYGPLTMDRLAGIYRAVA